MGPEDLETFRSPRCAKRGNRSLREPGWNPGCQYNIAIRIRLLTLGQPCRLVLVIAESAHRYNFYLSAGEILDDQDSNVSFQITKGNNNVYKPKRNI